MDQRPYTPQFDRRHYRWSALGVGSGRRQVADVSYLLGCREYIQRAARMWIDDRLSLKIRFERLWYVMKREAAEPLSLAQPEHSELGGANPSGIPEYGHENRLKIAG
jgi:hypothetical protein